MGLKRTKKLIAFCFNDRAAIKSDDDVHLLLSVIDVPDDGKEDIAVVSVHIAAVLTVVMEGDVGSFVSVPLPFQMQPQER